MSNPTAAASAHRLHGAPRRGGFTLVELLVVVAVIALLAGLLLPALGRTKSAAQGVLCLNNTKQLTLAWLMYASEYDDRLPYNLGGTADRKTVAPTTNMNWVNNVMTWELDSDNTNTLAITEASLGSFTARSVSLYRCPSDRVLSAVQRQAGWSARLRSYSMNAMVGHAGALMRYGRNVNNPGYKQFLRLGAIPRPADIYVFLDEHPDSINDGYFLAKPDEPEWLDLPGSYHNGAGSFSFADGHSELHKWVEPATRQAPRPDVVALPLPIPAEARADFDWLIQHTSVER